MYVALKDGDEIQCRCVEVYQVYKEVVSILIVHSTPRKGVQTAFVFSPDRSVPLVTHTRINCTIALAVQLPAKIALQEVYFNKLCLGASDSATGATRRSPEPIFNVFHWWRVLIYSIIVDWKHLKRTTN